MRLELQSNSEDQTIAIGRALGAMLRLGDVVALDGPLGAGKTRLVRGIASGMGLDESTVSSPTFVFVHEYRSAQGGGRLYHVDAYRLHGPDDLDTLGWDTVTDGSGAVVIEWAERIAPALPAEPSPLRVRMEHGGAGETARRIAIEGSPAWSGRAGWERVLAAGGLGGSGKLPPGWAPCPITGRPVPEDSPTFPFADERARMADLGKWLGGGYVVSREIKPEDADDPDLSP